MSDKINNVIKTSLQILPHFVYDDSDHLISVTQKCLIPSEILPELKSQIDPIYVKCTELENDKDFICQLRPLRSTNLVNYCHLDETVYMYKNTPSLSSSSSSSLITERRLSHIEILNYNKEKIKKMSVIVTINENALNRKLTRYQLITVLKNFLQLFVLVEDAHINCTRSYNELYGIYDIRILKILDPPSSSLSSSTSIVFKINDKTEIDIINFKYKNDNNSISKYMNEDLEDLNEISMKLNKLLIDIKLQNQLLCHQIKSSQMSLIIGLSGTGKSAVCHNFFIQNQCNIFEIIPANIFGQYPGEAEENLRKIFQNAIYFIKKFKPKDPTVIFIENIELIGLTNKQNSNLSSASTNENYSTRIGSQFLSLLDIINQTKNLNLLIIGTTSDIDKIDPALRRPGRFENEISMPLLTENGRKNILKKFLKKFSTNIDENILKELSLNLAQKSVGFTGADMKLLIHNFNRKILQHESDLNFEKIKNNFEEILIIIRPTTIRGADITCITCDEKFEDVGGMENLKKSLQISILTALKNPEIFKKFGLELPKGILLYGPPGCAKTTIAKCIANETKMRFISTTGAEVYSPYVGKAEKFITKIFDTARKSSPCIIFLDEIDTLIGNRQVGLNNDVQTRVLSTLLTEMDGIGLHMKNFSINCDNIKILIIAATNRPDLIDNALIRPGRFDKLIHVPIPDNKSRLDIFNIYSKRMLFDTNIDFNLLAKQTELYSGADVCNLCNEAGIHALTVHSDNEKILMNDFIEVQKTFKSSLTKDQIEWYKKFEQNYH